ncbi:MAG TPA: hypothetical protein VII33_10310, partial [Nakamurella sp.]
MTKSGSDRLERHWSPEQISNALPIKFPAQRETHVMHETIYPGGGRFYRSSQTPEGIEGCDGPGASVCRIPQACRIVGVIGGPG